MNNKSLPACKTLVGTIATLCSALCSSMLASAGAVAQGTALDLDPNTLSKPKL
jgi:hypothetical protein